MANKILNLIFKADATDATRELNKFKGETGSTDTGAGGTGVLGVTSALKASITPALALGTSLMGVGYILKGELDKYTEYITEVDNLSVSLGLAVDEGSFLVSAMNQYNISNDTMVAVFRKLSAEGIDPTIENLGILLQQWEDMEEGSEKGQFAMQMFGEQGIKQLLPWWDKLSDAQKEAFGYQETGLKVTQDMVTETRELNLVTGHLTGEWDTLKGQLVEGVLPTLITIGQYIYISMEYSRRLRKYLTGLKIPDSGAPKIPGLPGYDIPIPGPGDDGHTYPKGGYATGGNFTVGGSGGTDSQNVNFMATPGETVSVGGGTSDMQNILSEVRRLVDSLPVAIADAVERR